MGKRSDFKKVERSLYKTKDWRAFAALKPFVKPGMVFCEPCAGEGDLIDGLESMGLICSYAGDVEPLREGIKRRDALTLTKPSGGKVKRIITNPPWDRKILHAMIWRFIDIADEVWLLFDSDWAFTQNAMQFSDVLTDIVAIGRLNWIEGTAYDGKDNCSWYRFSRDHVGATRFWPRTEATSKTRK